MNMDDITFQVRVVKPGPVFFLDHFQCVTLPPRIPAQNMLFLKPLKKQGQVFFPQGFKHDFMICHFVSGITDARIKDDPVTAWDDENLLTDPAACRFFPSRESTVYL